MAAALLLAGSLASLLLHPLALPAGGTAAMPDPDRLDDAFRRAAELPALTSLIVSQGGAVVREEYFRGMNPGRQVNIKSASKSILSALVGIALEEGYLQSLEQTLPELLPDHFPADAPQAHRTITLRHLLTMTAGLQTTSFRNYGSWVASRDWVRAAIDRPMVDRPGGRMIYSTGNSHLVSAILTRATGTSTRAFAQRHLFEPLGIGPPAWDRDPQGFYLGGNNMALTPLDLWKIGELYRAGGELDGRRILSESWIRESWTRNRRSRWNGYGYGYYWWHRRSGQSSRRKACFTTRWHRTASSARTSSVRTASASGRSSRKVMASLAVSASSSAA